MTSMCECQVCKQGRKFEQTIKGLKPSAKKWMMELYEHYLSVCEDLDMRRNADIPNSSEVRP
jgi:hypothetical protein